MGIYHPVEIDSSLSFLTFFNLFYSQIPHISWPCPNNSSNIQDSFSIINVGLKKKIDHNLLNHFKYWYSFSWSPDIPNILNLNEAKRCFCIFHGIHDHTTLTITHIYTQRHTKPFSSGHVPHKTNLTQLKFSCYLILTSLPIAFCQCFFLLMWNKVYSTSHWRRKRKEYHPWCW